MSAWRVLLPTQNRPKYRIVSAPNNCSGRGVYKTFDAARRSCIQRLAWRAFVHGRANLWHDSVAAYLASYDSLIRAGRRMKHANATLADPVLVTRPTDLAAALTEKSAAEDALRQATAAECAAFVKLS